MSFGFKVNVLFELDPDGLEDIWTQEIKLLLEISKDPKQDVSNVFVVTDVLSIDSEKVTDTDELTEIEVSPSDGLDEFIDGGIVSELFVVLLSEESLFFDPDSFLPQVVKKILIVRKIIIFDLKFPIFKS